MLCFLGPLQLCCTREKLLEKCPQHSMPMYPSPLQGEVGEGDRRDIWGKCTSFGHGNVRGERRVEDLGSAFFVLSIRSPLLTLKYHSSPGKVLLPLMKKNKAQ